MADYVFINPSPNMELVAKTVMNMGNSARRIFTSDYTGKSVDTFWCHAGGSLFELDNSRKAKELDGAVMCLKKPLFANFRYSYIKNKTAAVNPAVISSNIQDYVLLSSHHWKEAEVPVEVSDLNFDGVLSKFPQHIIVASMIPASGGKRNITAWRTDYDFQDALGNDYYFFFDKNGRHEMFSDGDRLVTISDNQKNLNWLKNINPTMNRFAFEKMKSVNYHVNTKPWIQKYSSRVYLVNDYSWQGISAVLPDGWAKAVQKAISVKK